MSGVPMRARTTLLGEDGSEDYLREGDTQRARRGACGPHAWNEKLRLRKDRDRRGNRGLGRIDLRADERREHGGGVRTAAHREGPESHRRALADPLPSLPREGRNRPDVGDRRHRDRSLGHQGQSAWRAYIRAARRQDEGAHLVLREVGRQHARGSRRARAQLHFAGSNSTEGRPFRPSRPLHSNRGRKAGRRETKGRSRGCR